MVGIAIADCRKLLAVENNQLKCGEYSRLFSICAEQ